MASPADLKPENILLDGNGNLKIADFGLAVLFQYQGKYRESTSVCGSPPYAAPEVSSAALHPFLFPADAQHTQVIVGSYRADIVDIWSCGVVLFTLLVGNTPWDEPTRRSAEYDMYVETRGRPTYEPWPSIPNDVLCELA